MLHDTRDIQSLKKEAQAFKRVFGGFKLLIFKAFQYQWLCPSIKTFTTEICQRYDFAFRFGIENLKS